MSDDETGSDEIADPSAEAEGIGVTSNTHRRRLREFHDLLRFANFSPGDTIPGPTLLKWAHTKPPRSRLTYVTTVIAALHRRNIPTTHAQAVVREIKLRHLLEAPMRAVPATIADMAHVSSWHDQELKALLDLCWSFAARMTSITQLQMTDLAIRGNHLRATFRAGKTITSTGPYTITAVVDKQTIAYLCDIQEHTRRYPFPMPIDTYYRRSRKVLAPLGLQVRSLRRGALQLLATTTPPQDLLLLSRHTSIKSLYSYLDDGKFAHWEHAKLLQLTSLLHP